MTLKASLKPLKPSFFKPRVSYFERYRPAKMSFSRVANRLAFRTETAIAVPRVPYHCTILHTRWDSPEACATASTRALHGLAGDYHSQDRAQRGSSEISVATIPISRESGPGAQINHHPGIVKLLWRAQPERQRRLSRPAGNASGIPEIARIARVAQRRPDDTR